MKYDTIIVSKEKDTATVILNRPNVHNAFNDTLMKELTRCFEILGSDDDLRLIILTGSGKSFCAGADINWMKSMINYSIEENIRDSKLLLDLYEMIYSCPKPVLGRINGHVFGGGLGLLAVCDITIAFPNLKFAFSEVKLGIIPSVISTYVIRRIGPAIMRRLFITGEQFDSSYAHQIGLVDFVVSEEEIDIKIQEYVELIRSSGPYAIGEVKSLVSRYEMMDIERYKDFTVKKIAELRNSAEGQEGLNAFLEKKKAKWRC